jgi:aldose 1-epimerase
MATRPDETFALHSDCGGAELWLAPAVGGSVAAYRVGDQDILRPASRSALARRDPRGLSAFPLFPFSGRIANGRFRVGDREIALPPNFPPERHAIHGQAWQNPWRVLRRAGASATLEFEHAGGDWPWAYRASQTFLLSAGALTLHLSLMNRASTAMPAGIGWHPYFPKGDALFSANLNRIWLSGKDKIPDAPAPLEGGNALDTPRAVAALDLDNAFSRGDGPCTLAWPGRGIEVRLTASEALGHLVIFTPPDEGFFCVEPVSHAPNAVNSDLPGAITGLRLLGPGESMSASIGLGWVPNPL